jgi:putative membrane protein
MGLGFVIERFGLFIKLMGHESPLPDSQSTLSLYIGVGFILLGAGTALLSALQFVVFIKTLGAQEKPRGHISWLPPAVNVFLSVSATALSVWLVLSR